MNLARNCGLCLAALACLLSPLATANSQVLAASPPTPTIWRFMGIPQGIQKVRDVTTNRRGNRPALERRAPLTRIADPANLESSNPAIKAAAEIKTAEDMKQQKIKAIKYLATIGCGCYDKDGKVTDALLAATDDCTPDVRKAVIEAINDAADNDCCRKCGSTSCCNEKITKRLSEMAYERDDTGCHLEPSAEIRRMACVVLHKCCPNGPPSGPIEEEMIDEQSIQEQTLPTPDPQPEEPQMRGESDDSEELEPIRGESISSGEAWSHPNVERSTLEAVDAEVLRAEAPVAGEQLKLIREMSHHVALPLVALDPSPSEPVSTPLASTPELVEVEVEWIGSSAKIQPHQAGASAELRDARGN